MNNEKIGKFITNLRKEIKLTQEDLAIKMYTDRTTISKWERGVYIPKNDDILKLCEIFSISVNEFYYGEKINNENIDKINEVPIEIVKINYIKRKKLIAFFSCIIIALVSAFFLMYFINNYKSISVYKLGADNSKINLEGIVVISKEKIYINITNIYSVNKNDQIKSITYYYLDGDNKVVLFTTKSSSYLYINRFNKQSLIQYEQLKKAKKSFYIDIEYKNKPDIETISISLNKDFINSKLFYKSYKSKKDSKAEKIVSQYVKKYYNFNEKGEYYYLDYQKDKVEIHEKIYINVGLYQVEEIEAKRKIIYEYDKRGDLFYNDGKEEFNYNFKTEKCLFRECRKKIINYFIKNYMDKALENK